MNIIADNYNESLSSCYFLDLRNSTSLMREISLGNNHNESKNSERLRIHASFLMEINEFIINKLNQLNHNKYYYNDTGDGHLCLFWDKTHAWTALKIACGLAEYLKKTIANYNENQLKKWSNQIDHKLKLGFGIGMHMGGSLICYNENIKRQFVFGIVTNSASRVESYTKQFVDLPFLFTKNFNFYLHEQLEFDAVRRKDWEPKLKKIKEVTHYKVDIKDSKSRGHLLYTISSQDWKLFAK
jgi:hypothetical protein